MADLPNIPLPRISHLEKIDSLFGDIGKRIDDAARFGGSFTKKIKESAKATESLNKQMNELAEDMADHMAKHGRYSKSQIKQAVDLNLELKKVQLTSKGIAKELGKSLSDSLNRVGNIVIGLGLSGLQKGIHSLYGAMQRIYELQERWTRAMGAFNMRIGAFSPSVGSARKEATKWEGTIRGLTDNFGEGLEMFQDYTEGFGRILPDKEEAKWGKLGMGIARGMGLGAKASGEWMRSAFHIGQTTEDIAETFKLINISAIDANVPVNSLTKEFSEAREMIISFGKDGQKAFIQNFTAMKKLGLSLKSLEQFMRSTDNFDDAAKSMAKINTLFGTTVNALELMLENDPSKRMEMIRRQMLSQGKTYEQLSRREREVLAETMKVSQDELAAVLRDNKTLESVQKDKEKKEIEKLKGEELIRKATLKTAQTQFAMGQAYDMLTRKISKMLTPLFETLGFIKKGSKGFVDFASALRTGTKWIGDFIDKVARNQDFKNTLIFIGEKVKDFVSFLGKGAKNKNTDEWISSLSKGFKDMFEAVEDIVKSLWKFFTNPTLQKTVRFFVDNIGKLTTAFIGLKIALAGMRALSFSKDMMAMLSMATGHGGGGMGALGGGTGGIGAAAGIAGKAAMGAGIGLAAGSATGALQEGLGTENTTAGTIAGALGGALGMAIGGPVGAAVFGATAQALTNGLPDLWKALTKKASSYEDEDPYAAEKALAKKRDPLQTQKNTLWLQREKEKQKIEETIEQQITDKKLTNEKDINKLRKKKLDDLEKWEKDNINSRMIAQMEAVAIEKGMTADEYYKLVEGVIAGQTKSSGSTFGASEGIGYKLLEAINGRGPLFTREEKKRPVWTKHGFEEGLKPFASGGIVTSPTRALIGEAGPEAVIPLRAIARPESQSSMKLGGNTAKKIVNLASKGNTGANNKHVEVVSSNVYLDGRLVGRHLTRINMT